MEGYEFIDEDKLPVLVLGIKQNPSHPRGYKFKVHAGAVKVGIQTAGYACLHHYFDVVLLKPREPVKVKAISKMYLDSCMGMWGRPPLQSMNEYNETLRELLGVSCELTCHELEEGLYPIDLTQEHIKHLCTNRLPKDLDNLIEWDGSWDRMCGSFNRWGLYILGENCD